MQELAGLLKQAQRQIAALDHILGDFQIAHLLVAGQVIHQIEHEFFEDHAQAARSNLTSQGFTGNRSDGVRRKVQANVLEFKQALILLYDCVARLGQDFNESSFVELIENAHNRQTADKLGNQAILNEILRLGLAQQLGIAMGAGGGGIGLGIHGLEAQGLFADAPSHARAQGPQTHRHR